MSYRTIALEKFARQKRGTDTFARASTPWRVKDGEEKEEETIFYQFNQEQEEFSGQIFLAIIHLSLDPFLIEFY